MTQIICSTYQLPLPLGSEQRRFLGVLNKEGTFRIPLRDIYYIESRERHLHIQTAEDCYVVHGALRELDHYLDSKKFMRNHKSFVVNLYHIVKVYKDDITLDNHESIPLSKHRASSLRRALRLTMG